MPCSTVQLTVGAKSSSLCIKCILLPSHSHLLLVAVASLQSSARTEWSRGEKVETFGEVVAKLW